MPTSFQIRKPFCFKSAFECMEYKKEKKKNNNVSFQSGIAESIRNEEFQHFVAMSISIFNLFSFFFLFFFGVKSNVCVMAQEVDLSPLNGVYIYCLLEWAQDLPFRTSEHNDEKNPKETVLFLWNSKTWTMPTE